MRTAIIRQSRDIPLGVDFFGVTTGNLSLVDVLSRVMEYTGRAAVDIATWSIGMQSLRRLVALDKTSVRILIDRSYAPRNKEYTRKLLRSVGSSNVRFTHNHAKFVVVGDVVIHSSMNFNTNRRYESVSIHHDAAIAAFLRGVIDEWFAEPAINPHNCRQVRDAYE